ncbi:unnamed protein product [Prunus armeniaca]
MGLNFKLHVCLDELNLPCLTRISYVLIFFCYFPPFRVQGFVILPRVVMKSIGPSSIIRDHLYSMDDKLKRGRPLPLLKSSGEDIVIDGDLVPETAPVVDPASISRCCIEKGLFPTIPLFFQYPCGISKGWSEWVDRELKDPSSCDILNRARVLDATFLSKACDIHIEAKMLCHVVRRWSAETHTFIYSWGEFTPTLEDVANIFHFPICGGQDPFHVMLIPRFQHFSLPNLMMWPTLLELLFYFSRFHAAHCDILLSIIVRHACLVSEEKAISLSEKRNLPFTSKSGEIVGDFSKLKQKLEKSGSHCTGRSVAHGKRKREESCIVEKKKQAVKELKKFIHNVAASGPPCSKGNTPTVPLLQQQLAAFGSIKQVREVPEAVFSQFASARKGKGENSGPKVVVTIDDDDNGSDKDDAVETGISIHKQESIHDTSGMDEDLDEDHYYSRDEDTYLDPDTHLEKSDASDMPPELVSDCCSSEASLGLPVAVNDTTQVASKSINELLLLCHRFNGYVTFQGALVYPKTVVVLRKFMDKYGSFIEIIGITSSFSRSATFQAIGLVLHGIDTMQLLDITDHRLICWRDTICEAITLGFHVDFFLNLVRNLARAIHRMKSSLGFDKVKPATDALNIKQRELEDQRRELHALLLTKGVSADSAECMAEATTRSSPRASLVLFGHSS